LKLIRFGKRGSEKPGLLLDGIRRDLSSQFRDWDSDFFASGGLNSLKALVERRGAEAFPEVAAGERWGAPIVRPHKIICIGLNFHDHAHEAGMEIPKEPILFMKATNTMVGPYDDLLIPRRSSKTDWEVELGVVIGKEARYLESAEKSAEYIAGNSSPRARPSPCSPDIDPPYAATGECGETVFSTVSCTAGGGGATFRCR